MTCDKMVALLFFCLVGLSLAHVHLEYNPTDGMTVRNAQTPTSDGQFSVAADGCGGETTFGANGVNNVTIGAGVTMKFNYGTGTNGDHADPSNVFHVAVVPLQATSAATLALMKDETYWLATVPASQGSRPAGYEATITIPTTCTGQCVLVVDDQRNWGGCHDLQVTDPGITVEGLTSGAKKTANVVANTDTYYSIAMTGEQGAFVSVTLPTGVQAAVKRASIPSLEANDEQTATSGTLAICDAGGSPGFIGVFQSATATGSYSVTATAYQSALTINELVNDEISGPGYKYYSLLAFSLEDAPRRIVVRKTGGDGSISLLRGPPEVCPPTEEVSNNAVNVGCVEAGEDKGKKYLKLETDGQLQYSILVEKGSCADIVDEAAAGTVVASLFLLVASLALFF